MSPQTVNKPLTLCMKYIIYQSRSKYDCKTRFSVKSEKCLSQHDYLAFETLHTLSPLDPLMSDPASSMCILAEVTSVSVTIMHILPKAYRLGKHELNSESDKPPVLPPVLVHGCSLAFLNFKCILCLVCHSSCANHCLVGRKIADRPLH